MLAKKKKVNTILGEFNNFGDPKGRKKETKKVGSHYLLHKPWDKLLPYQVFDQVSSQKEKAQEIMEKSWQLKPRGISKGRKYSFLMQISKVDTCLNQIFFFFFDSPSIQNNSTLGEWSSTSTIAPTNPRGVRPAPQTHPKQIQKIHVAPPQHLDVQSCPHYQVFVAAGYRTPIP